MSTEISAADFVKGYEGYVSSAMWDVNAYRIGHGSDTITLPDGSYRVVKKGDVTTPEMARDDLARRIRVEFIPRIQGQIGVDAWNKLTEGCKIALIDFAYNYGSITKKKIREAAKTGDPAKISSAILSSTKNDNERLLHEGDDKDKPLKKGNAYTQAQKMRDALYNRRKAEAALCTDSSADRSMPDTSERSGGYGLWGIIFTALIVTATIWLVTKYLV